MDKISVYRLVRILFLLLGWCTLIKSLSSIKFNVVQYNIFGRPFQVSHDGQQERLARIPKALNSLCPEKTCGGIDVITLAEADIGSERENMLKYFAKEGFRYSTHVMYDPDPFTRWECSPSGLLNGGVIIVSKWPIMKEAQHVYRNACHYSDCLAAKGVVYARVVKTETNVSSVFNVFATHMQAWSTIEGREDRTKQAAQMHIFMTELNIPHNEPVIFAGDFNTDNISYPDEVSNLVSILNAKQPTVVGKQKYTSDPHTNLLVGRDGAAHSNKCINHYRQSWGQEKNLTFHPSGLSRVLCGEKDSVKKHSELYYDPTEMCYCSCCPFEWLDYILYSKEPYLQPLEEPTLQAMEIHSESFLTPWTSPQSNTMIEMKDFSDHYPVLASFKFPYDSHNPKPYVMDGCSHTSDCHFYAFRCYCTGPTCYYQGEQMSGIDLPATHPINKNCLYQKTGFDCLCGPT